MSVTAAVNTLSVGIRVLANITVIDTPVVSNAMEYAQTHSEPYLFNHAVRSWLFAVSSLLHDIGLTTGFAGPRRFEIEGADAARAFGRGQGLDERRLQLIWDSVALNSTPSIGMYKEPEVAICTAGVVLDFGGPQYDQISPDEMNSILAAFPRLGMKRCFTDAVCEVVKTKPQTTYDNFARDFGERFVPGYTRPSTVDFLMNAPFPE
jgi:hypothetical protein